MWKASAPRPDVVVAAVFGAAVRAGTTRAGVMPIVEAVAVGWGAGTG
ncbi:hypothetical protein ACFXD5_22500 [Streptomyces sp. NPDC059385]